MLKLSCKKLCNKMADYNLIKYIAVLCVLFVMNTNVIEFVFIYLTSGFVHLFILCFIIHRHGKMFRKSMLNLVMLLWQRALEKSRYQKVKFLFIQQFLCFT